MKRAILALSLSLISAYSFAKEYSCDSLTWVSPYGTNRYQAKIRVVVESNTVRLDVISTGGRIGKTFVPGGDRDVYFSTSPYKKIESTKKFGVETESTIKATNNRGMVEFRNNFFGFGYLNYRTKDGYGFYGQCD